MDWKGRGNTRFIGEGKKNVGHQPREPNLNFTTPFKGEILQIYNIASRNQMSKPTREEVKQFKRGMMQ